MAYPPQSIDLPLGGVRYDQDLVSAIAPEDLQAGLEYTVTSRELLPTPDELNRITYGDPSGYLPYTTVPGNVPAQVMQIAERWTAGATTAYEQVYAIQQHLLTFTYSLDVKLPKDPSAMVEFLTKTHTGFCQQFATAMAALVRELGIPARVAVGYLPGTLAGDTFTVTTEQAHSWVEVLFPGYGWLPFDPTPGRTKPPAPAGTYLNPVAAPADGGQGGSGQTADLAGGATSSCSSGLPGQLCNSDPALSNPGRPRRGITGDLGPLNASPDSGPSPYRILLLTLAALAALFAVLFPIGKGLWRRVALRRVGEPWEQVLTVYRIFDGEAADVGLGRGAGETMAEYRRRLGGTVEFSDGHLDRLTGLAVTAAYSGRAVSQAEAREAFRDARVAIRDVRRQAGVVRRILGMYRPGL